MIEHLHLSSSHDECHYPSSYIAMLPGILFHSDPMESWLEPVRERANYRVFRYFREHPELHLGLPGLVSDTESDEQGRLR